MMINNSVKQISYNSLSQESLDLIICATGYERRASYFSLRFSKLSSNLVCIGFKENKDKGSRKNNDLKFKKLGYKMIEFSGHDIDEAESFISDFLKQFESDKCKILIDISSMTRAWYGGFIHSLITETRITRITTFFSYIPGSFQPNPNLYPPNEIVGPVRGFSGLGLPNKPIALVIGLGQDRGRAIGIKESLDPGLTIIFNANPGSDKRYLREVTRANKELRERLSSNNIFDYPINDFITTYHNLEGVVSGLLEEWRVVLTSLGPKTFSLCCFLLAAKYSNISVWRISAGSRGAIIDSSPSKTPLFIEAQWSLLKS